MSANKQAVIEQRAAVTSKADREIEDKRQYVIYILRKSSANKCRNLIHHLLLEQIES